jgi:spoIIIJ-associated protein
MNDAVFTGVDVEEALRRAAESLGVNAAQIHHVVVDPGSPATPGRAATPARIAVMLETLKPARATAPVQTPASPAPAPAPAARPARPSRSRASGDSGGDGGDDAAPARRDTPRPPAAEAAAEFGSSVVSLGQAFSAALAVPFEMAVERQGERISVGVSGAGAEALDDAEGETLLALETILQRIAGRCGETARVVVANPARKSVREASLTAEALRLAQDVKERGLPRMMPPLNSYERRVVHMVLSQVEGIKTYSVGDGMERRLTIALSSENTAE